MGKGVRSNLWVMLLAGGRGERLWPLSRAEVPKPFLRMSGGKSLLRDTLDRALSVAPPDRIRILAGNDLSGLIRKDLGKTWGRRILREPASRNTGPACLLAASWLSSRDPQSTMLVLPSDHRIDGIAAFRRDVARARALAEGGHLITFAIPPTGPSADFGYLVPGEPIHGDGRKVSRFIEKPPQGRARLLLRRGALWNSGIFCWKTASFLDEASRAQQAYRRWLENAGGARHFARLPALPVDRSVLERSRRVAMVRARFTWSDVGSWERLSASARKDHQRNLLHGEVVAIQSSRNLVYREEGRCVLWGVDDLALLEAGGTLLICPRNRLSSLRQLLRTLRRRGGHHGF